MAGIRISHRRRPPPPPPRKNIDLRRRVARKASSVVVRLRLGFAQSFNNDEDIIKKINQNTTAEGAEGCGKAEEEAINSGSAEI